MKISELLELPILSNSKIIAGANSVSRTVQSISTVTNSELTDHLGPHELVLTKGEIFKNSTIDIVKLIYSIAKINCSGLCIQLDHLFPTFPEEVVQTANKINLPLIELPKSSTLVDITNETLCQILKRRTKELQFAIDSQREFSKLAHNGGTLDNIIDHLSAILNKPAILINHLHKVIAHTQYFRNHEMKKLLNLIIKHTDSIQSTKSNNYITIDGKNIHFYQIKTQHKKSYLIIIGFDLPVDEFTSLLIEQVSNIISYELLKQQALAEKTLHIKNSFFAALLDGNIPYVEIVRRGEKYGLKKGELYRVITCKIDPYSEKTQSVFIYNSLPTDVNKHTIYEYLNTRFIKEGIQVTMFINKEIFVFLLPIDQNVVQNEHELIKFLRSVQKDLSTQLRLSVSFGISNHQEEIGSIQKGYHNAAEALEIGYQHQRSQFIQTYRAKDIADLLQIIPIENLTEFYEGTLKELAYTTNKDLLSLVQTIAVYIENHCQIAETAKQLFVHRNTVVYRLEKFEELLNINIKEPDETLRLRIALLIRPYVIGTKKAASR